jgi:hypothetical protein
MGRGVRSAVGNRSGNGNYKDFEHISGITLIPLGS